MPVEFSRESLAFCFQKVGYGDVGSFVGERSCVHRDDPIYHTIIPAGYEHLLLGGIQREASLFQMVRQAVPTVKAVHMTPGGTCRYRAAISIKKTVEGQGKNAVFAALANTGQIDRELLERWVANGSLEECVEQIRPFIDAGATTVTLRMASYDQQGQFECALAYWLSC